jgi:hypothetical protein
VTDSCRRVESVKSPSSTSGGAETPSVLISQSTLRQPTPCMSFQILNRFATRSTPNAPHVLTPLTSDLNFLANNVVCILMHQIFRKTTMLLFVNDRMTARSLPRLCARGLFRYQLHQRLNPIPQLSFIMSRHADIVDAASDKSCRLNAAA